MTRLTDDVVKKHPRPASGQTFAWDDLVSGYGVRFTATKTTHVIQWRDPVTKKKPRESLRPAWPTLNVAAARDAARKRLGEVVALADNAGGELLRVAMRRWFEAQNDWRPRYRAKVDASIATYIEGADNPRTTLSATARKAIKELGEKPVALITRTDVLRVVDNIKRGAGEQLMAFISSYYGYAAERGVGIVNPARNRLRVTGGRNVRHRKLSDQEFISIYRATLLEKDATPDAFLLLALTGCRRREITQLRWSEVDLGAATITLPPERRKTGKRDPDPFVVNLHALAVDLLRRQPVLQGNEFVFFGRKTNCFFEIHSATMARLQAATDVKDWRLHDLRRYMRSGLAKLGVSQTVAEMTLGHKLNAFIGTYDQHDYQEEMGAAWLKWGDYLARLIAS